MIKKLLNLCVKDPSKYFSKIYQYISYFCIFFLSADGVGQMNIIENIEYKFLEVISLKFSSITDEIIRLHITYRFNLQRAKMMSVKNKLNEIVQIVKLKNCSLLS